MSNLPVQYPVLHLELEQDDDGFSKGMRFAIEQPDHIRLFFKEREGERGSEAFMATHGLRPVTNEEMKLVRQTLKIKKPRKNGR